ncbi:MAG: leucyl/phenylalanyl-tRNA--protein transferase [Pseudomonadota bacterium]
MTAPRIAWLTAADAPSSFPPADQALTEPDGLLAAGGDLSEARLLHAYRHGIFPWYDAGQPVLWWSPDPRCILRTGHFHLPRRAARALRKSGFDLAFNRRFADVVAACAAPRPGQHGTWITDDMSRAFSDLHASGWAHSIEVLQENRLVGGLYGLAVGRAFFGESMYSAASGASKGALLAACRILASEGIEMFDCQVQSRHLASLGADMIPRENFLSELERLCTPITRFSGWPKTRIAVASYV